MVMKDESRRETKAMSKVKTAGFASYEVWRLLICFDLFIFMRAICVQYSPSSP